MIAKHMALGSPMAENWNTPVHQIEASTSGLDSPSGDRKSTS